MLNINKINGTTYYYCYYYLLFTYIFYFLVVKQSLKDGPNWDSFVSTVETEIRKILENKRVINTTKNKPEQSETIELINKLIFEYMDWMGYKLTNSMFKKGM